MPGWAWLLVGVVAGVVVGMLAVAIYVGRAFRNF